MRYCCLPASCLLRGSLLSFFSLTSLPWTITRLPFRISPTHIPELVRMIFEALIEISPATLASCLQVSRTFFALGGSFTCVSSAFLPPLISLSPETKFKTFQLPSFGERYDTRNANSIGKICRGSVQAKRRSLWRLVRNESYHSIIFLFFGLSNSNCLGWINHGRNSILHSLASSFTARASSTSTCTSKPKAIVVIYADRIYKQH